MLIYFLGRGVHYFKLLRKMWDFVNILHITLFQICIQCGLNVWILRFNIHLDRQTYKTETRRGGCQPRLSYLEANFRCDFLDNRVSFPPKVRASGRYQAIPVPGHRGPYGRETSRPARFLENQLTDGCEVVSLTRRQHLHTPRKSPSTPFC
jgi:hypothetical protein